jgi:hypothetical protein
MLVLLTNCVDISFNVTEVFSMLSDYNLYEIKINLINTEMPRSSVDRVLKLRSRSPVPVC